MKITKYILDLYKINKFNIYLH